MDDAALVEAVHGALVAALLAENGQAARPAVETATLRALVADRARFTRASAELARAFVAWLRARNQFVFLTTEEKAALVPLFARSLRALADAPGEAVVDHVRRLGAWLRAALGGLPPEVPSAEYSAELQLELLGLRPEALVPPVLDLGCGRSAHLVRHLRDQGVEAYGVDPQAEGSFVVGGDWLAFDYGRARWGTVISHQGFSLHFLHHHFGKAEAARRYGVVYMAILDGLVPGGSFVYAPALPFIEALLPAEYEVVRRPLPAELAESLAWVRERDPDLDVAHATRVRRTTPG